MFRDLNLKNIDPDVDVDPTGDMIKTVAEYLAKFDLSQLLKK